MIILFSSCADLFHREIVACFRSRKICVCRWVCASFDSLECLSIVFLSQLFCFTRNNVYLSWLIFLFLATRSSAGFLRYWLFLGWLIRQPALWQCGGWWVVAILRRLAMQRPAGCQSPGWLPVFPHLHPREWENITHPFSTCLAYLGDRIWHLNVGHIWGNESFPKFLLWF